MTFVETLPLLISLAAILILLWFFAPFIFPSYWWKKRIYKDAWRHARRQIKQESNKRKAEHHEEQARKYAQKI